MSDAAPMRQRRPLLTPEAIAAQREQERPGAILSRLRGARFVEQPKTGWWLMRAVKGGPEVPASIQWERTEHEPGEPQNLMDRSPVLTARIAGRIVALDRVWNWTKREISKAEFDYRTSEAAWAAVHAPHEPAANPRKKLDLMQAPLPF